MTKKFHERFDIQMPLEEAKRRFVNRVHNDIYETAMFRGADSEEYHAISRMVASHLGDRYQDTVLLHSAGYIFERNLQALEGLYEALGAKRKVDLQRNVDQHIQRLIGSAEMDLGIRWQDGHFYPTGAALLDEKLVNDSLHWLREKQYANVADPFEKGLRHLLEANKRPELTADVVTDVYEALEALAGTVTGRPGADLSANHELFISAVKASEPYKKLLREYIQYANLFRHAEKARQPRPKISLEEAESFAYLTGVFIRLAITAKT